MTDVLDTTEELIDTDFEVNFDFDAPVPKVERIAPRAPRRKVKPWEQLLDPIRQNQGKAPRVFVFASDPVLKDGQPVLNEDGTPKMTNARSQATARVAAVNKRLREKVPMEKWLFYIRAIDSNPNHIGVWIKFDHLMTADEYEENERARRARADKIKAGRADHTKSDTPTGATEEALNDGDGDGGVETPAEKVAKARRDKASVK